MKRTVPLFIAGIVGFVLIVSTFIPYTEGWGQESMIWFNILAATAFVLGGGNILKLNFKKISDRREGWGYSVVTVVSFIVTLVVGLGLVGVHPSKAYPDVAWSGGYVDEGGWFWWIYNYMIYPVTSTMFAMLAFYIASAAFRAFRAKNVEAMLLLGTAFIILLGRTYAGVFLTGWLPESLEPLRLDRLTDTIMNVFNLAGTRAIMIGIALGVVSTSLKVILGVDRSYLGSDKE